MNKIPIVRRTARISSNTFKWKWMTAISIWITIHTWNETQKKGIHVNKKLFFQVKQIKILCYKIRCHRNRNGRTVCLKRACKWSNEIKLYAENNRTIKTKLMVFINLIRYYALVLNTNCCNSFLKSFFFHCDHNLFGAVEVAMDFPWKWKTLMLHKVPATSLIRESSRSATGAQTLAKQNTNYDKSRKVFWMILLVLLYIPGCGAGQIAHGTNSHRFFLNNSVANTRTCIWETVLLIFRLSIDCGCIDNHNLV